MTLLQDVPGHAPLPGAALPAAWPPSLRGAVEISLASPVGMLVLAGPDLLCVCNGAAAALLGDETAHVADPANGLPAPLCLRWPQAHALADAVAMVMASGSAHRVDQAELAMTVDGIVTRRRVMLACSPLAVSSSGAAKGVLVVIVEANAVQLAAALQDGMRAPDHLALTSRELQIFKLIGAGLQVKQVAGVLDISVSSVNTYRSRIFRKMGLASNAAVIRYALKHGLVN
jgi:DNA-binding NarL/FixJ family response regulator